MGGKKGKIQEKIWTSERIWEVEGEMIKIIDRSGKKG
jgi:hypothetical protein